MFVLLCLNRGGVSSSSKVVVPTPMGPMGFCKSTRDLKELSAGKEHTNEVRDGGRDPGVRRPGAGLSQSPASSWIGPCNPSRVQVFQFKSVY